MSKGLNFAEFLDEKFQKLKPQQVVRFLKIVEGYRAIQGFRILDV